MGSEVAPNSSEAPNQNANKLPDFKDVMQYMSSDEMAEYNQLKGDALKTYEELRSVQQKLSEIRESIMERTADAELGIGIAGMNLTAMNPINFALSTLVSGLSIYDASIAHMQLNTVDDVDLAASRLRQIAHGKRMRCRDYQNRMRVKYSEDAL